MSQIPYEITTDVLLQLPVKALLRFRCLSGPIRSLIDGLYFIRLHLSHSIRTKSDLFLILQGWTLHIVDLDSSPSVAAPLDHHPLYNGGGTEVLGSCDGLVALRNSDRNLAFYNISTRKFKRLPSPEINLPVSVKTGYVFYGFGYDSVSDDYKLLRMAHLLSDEVSYYGYQVSVYCLKSDSWKRIEILPHYLPFLYKPFYHLLHGRGYGVYACNTLHWVVPQSPPFGVENSVMAFDLGVDAFREVSLPDYDNKELNPLIDVGVLEGCLCLMCSYRHVGVDVWMMKEYPHKESWTKLFSFSRRTVADFMFLRPLVYSKGGDKVLLELSDHKFVWYDWHKKKTTTFRIHDSPKIFGAVMYVASLVPLPDDGEIERQQKKQQEDDEKNRSNAYTKRDDFLSMGFKLKL